VDIQPTAAPVNYLHASTSSSLKYDGVSRGTHLKKSFLYVLPAAAGATLGGAS
jgi:hypothetical protein